MAQDLQEKTWGNFIQVEIYNSRVCGALHHAGIGVDPEQEHFDLPNPTPLLFPNI